jgi:3-hydroxybutyryl-CoA dehydratase
VKVAGVFNKHNSFSGLARSAIGTMIGLRQAGRVCVAHKLGLSGKIAANVLRRCNSDFVIEGTLATNGPVIGSYAEVKHAFQQSTVNQFAKMCGDTNPLHSDPEFAKTTMFGGTIVHGIFVSSLISTLFGRSIDGSVYVSQTLNFRSPVHVGKEVTARMEIIDKSPRRSGDLLTCKTTCMVDGKICVDGEAKVLVPKST